MAPEVLGTEGRKRENGSNNATYLWKKKLDGGQRGRHTCFRPWGDASRRGSFLWVNCPPCLKSNPMCRTLAAGNASRTLQQCSGPLIDKVKYSTRQFHATQTRHVFKETRQKGKYWSTTQSRETVHPMMSSLPERAPRQTLAETSRLKTQRKRPQSKWKTRREKLGRARNEQKSTRQKLEVKVNHWHHWELQNVKDSVGKARFFLFWYPRRIFIFEKNAAISPAKHQRLKLTCYGENRDDSDVLIRQR